MANDQLPTNHFAHITTLGQLKKSGYKSRSVKAELRENLIRKLRLKEDVFPGIFGYEETVIPDLQRAILSMHHINLLGLRGQANPYCPPAGGAAR